MKNDVVHFEGEAVDVRMVRKRKPFCTTPEAMALRQRLTDSGIVKPLPAERSMNQIDLIMQDLTPEEIRMLQRELDERFKRTQLLRAALQ